MCLRLHAKLEVSTANAKTGTAQRCARWMYDANSQIRCRRRMAGIIRIHFLTLNINDLFNITYRWRAVRVYSRGAETEIFDDPGIYLRMSNTVGYLVERIDEHPIGRISSAQSARKSWRDADGSRGIRSSTSPITHKKKHIYNKNNLQEILS